MKKNTWRKITLVLVSLVLIIVSFPAIADGEEFNIENGVLIKYLGNGGEVTVPDGVTVLGESAFSGSAVTKVNLPETLTAIRSWCFSECYLLSDITLPASLEQIETDEDSSTQAQVFCRNNNLREIKVAAGNTHYTSVDGVLYTADKTKLLYCPAGKSKGQEYVVPEGTTEIGYTAFDGCDFTSVTLPSTFVRFSSDGELSFMSRLQEIKVAEGNTTFSSFNGALYQNKSLIAYPCGKTDEKVTASDFLSGITGIGAFVFQGNQYIKELEIPNTVTSIGWRAIESDVLEELTIPTSLEGLSKYGIFRCNKLNKLVVLSTDLVFNEDAVDSCPNVTIYGYANSTAETFAKSNNIPFEVLESTGPSDLTEIDSVTITITAPEVGSNAGVLPVVTLPSDAHYILSRTRCQWMDDMGQLFEDHVFSSGEICKALISLTPEEGYAFSKNTKVNVINGEIDPEFNSSIYETDLIYFIADVTAAEPKKPETQEQSQEQPQEQSQEQSQEQQETEIPASIHLSKTKVTIKDGKACTVAATLANPEDTIASVKSDKTKIATVKFSGNDITITPKNKGKATITVTTAKGATEKVTVTIKEGWSLNEKKVTLKPKKTFKIKVQGIPSSVKAKTFTSNKPAVATVDAKGKVKALKKGSATISVTLTNGKTLKLKVTVK